LATGEPAQASIMTSRGQSKHRTDRRSGSGELVIAACLRQDCWEDRVVLGPPRLGVVPFLPGTARSARSSRIRLPSPAGPRSIFRGDLDQRKADHIPAESSRGNDDQ
jgi:hypothetical protein